LGGFPAPLQNRWQAVEPLEERLGFEIDKSTVARWLEALKTLKTDHNAVLPNNDDHR
jgi:hypothetical protein